MRKVVNKEEKAGARSTYECAEPEPETADDALPGRERVSEAIPSYNEYCGSREAEALALPPRF